MRIKTEGPRRRKVFIGSSAYFWGVTYQHSLKRKSMIKTFSPRELFLFLFLYPAKLNLISISEVIYLEWLEFCYRDTISWPSRRRGPLAQLVEQLTLNQ